MITISLCMIVKNEEKNLKRCLSCVADLMDEIIIVDTGSVDKTKEIALGYTDKVYDFKWIGDFAAARNFAFSKATGDYIYSADADEILDETNRERFRILKENMYPEIEIVQMYYTNQLKFRTIYNYDKEYRPKLFKRVRNFTWIDPVHETVRTKPVVFDSDVEIIHEQETNHAKRDLEALCQAGREGRLSERLFEMYARELYFAGDREDFENGVEVFEAACKDDDSDSDKLKIALAIMVKAARVLSDERKFFKYTVKAIAFECVSEICLELGNYYMEQEDYEEAALWYYNAAYETESIIDARSRGDIPLNKMAECCRKLGHEEKAEYYEKSAKDWHIQSEREQ
ncbi:MAG: glycosyltransferase family 2 protein [Lachnospiraceae bacterium]|nr:glycosyltransferase family 2 protein [Lachnospiraceae bacterium]MCI9342888.1 glycosyltransferase family 2 protein [Lachnospiraceae bacterium]